MYIKDQISLEKLQALKLKLPYGAVIQIARDLDMSRTAVDKVFAGKIENDEVIDLAIKIIEERKKDILEKESKIDKVLSN